MTATSGTCDQMTSEVTSNIISSPESASGPTPFAEPDGPMLDPFGPVPAPASPSAPPAPDAATRTSATYGRIGIGSSASAALQRSLVSRLMLRLGQAGSTMFSYRSKRLITPSGRSIFRLAASARRTSGSGSTSWPTTPTMRGAELELAPKGPGADLPTIAATAAWASPKARDHKSEKGRERSEQYRRADLSKQVLSADGGPVPNGSSVLTGSGALLDPAFALWLMGLPSDWAAAAPMRASRGLECSEPQATPSSPRRPKRSSGRT